METVQLLTSKWGTPPRRYHKAQYEIRTSKTRGRLMDCGRRSGKSLLSCEILVSHLLDEIPGCPRPLYICAAPVQHQANEIFWDLLLDLIPDEWIDGGKGGDNVRLSDPRNIMLANGARVTIAGLDKPHRIEGKYINGFVCSETSDCKPGIFDRTIRPMLSDFHGWYILEGVPKRQGIGAAWYRNLCERVTATEERKKQGLPPSEEDYPDCIRRTWPAWDIMDSKEVAEAKRTMSPEDFEEQFGAKWTNIGGSVWTQFNREFNVRPCEHRNNLPIICGQDFNITPMSWTLSHKVGDFFETFDEMVVNNTNTAQMMNMLWSKWGHHKGGWQFYGDASGKKHTTNSPVSDYAIVANHEQFKMAGRSMHYPPANPNRRDRFAAANARLCTADGVRHAFIDPKCVKLIEDMQMRSYTPGTMLLPKNEGMIGHVSDSFSYPIFKLWRIGFDVGKNSNRIFTTEGPAIEYPRGTHIKEPTEILAGLQ